MCDVDKNKLIQRKHKYSPLDSKKTPNSISEKNKYYFSKMIGLWLSSLESSLVWC